MESGSVTLPSRRLRNVLSNRTKFQGELVLKKNSLAHYLKWTGGILKLTGDQRDHLGDNRIHPRTRTSHSDNSPLPANETRLKASQWWTETLYTSFTFPHLLFSFSHHSSSFFLSLLAFLLQKHWFAHVTWEFLTVKEANVTPSSFADLFQHNLQHLWRAAN